MKIAGVIFTILGILGAVCSGYIDGGIKLVTMAGSLGSLMCGIGFILSYVNFEKLYNITADDNRKSLSKAA